MGAGQVHHLHDDTPLVVWQDITIVDRACGLCYIRGASAGGEVWGGMGASRARTRRVYIYIYIIYI